MNKALKPQSAHQGNVTSTEKKLLQFRADWITCNVMAKSSLSRPKSLRFLDSLFALSHNETNASEYDAFLWSDGETEVMLDFNGKKQMGEELFIRGFKGKKLMRIIKIDKEWAKNINYPYEYQIACYGTFFDYDRLCLLNAKKMLGVFLDDIALGNIRHSVSRADICADLAGYQVKGIYRGIRGDEAHMKKINIRNVRNPETMEFGTKEDKWMARAYNKLLECQKKMKEWIYLQLGYFGYQSATRLEAELHSDICLNNSLTLPLCFDNEYLFGIFKSLLHTKYVQFQVIPFIERELKKSGFKIVTPVKREHNPKELTEMQYLNRVFSMIDNALLRYGITADELLKQYQWQAIPETGISSNQDELPAPEFVRTLFSSK